jgi:hypothetical protein
VVPTDAVARVSVRPSRPATLLRVQSTISGFAATGGAEASAVGIGASTGEALGAVDDVAAGEGEALALGGAIELAGASIDVAGLDPGVVHAARTDIATAPTMMRIDACRFTSSLAV